MDGVIVDPRTESNPSVPAIATVRRQTNVPRQIRKRPR